MIDSQLFVSASKIIVIYSLVL